MSERSTPNYRRRRVAAGTALLLAAVAGKVVDDKIDDFRANLRQPDCTVPVRPGDTVREIQARMKANGEDVRGENVVILAPDGHERTGRDGYTGGSITLSMGDLVRIDHVDPLVCIASGGLAPKSIVGGIDVAPGAGGNPGPEPTTARPGNG